MINVKDFFVITENSAFNTYKLFKYHEQWYILAEIFERIKSGLSIYKNLSLIDIQKVREAILPAFLNDGLIEEYIGGFKALKQNIKIGGDEEKYSLIKNLYKWVFEATEKVTIDDLENTKFYVSILKQVKKSEYDKLMQKLMDYSNEIVSLSSCNDENEEKVSFDFIVYFSHKKYTNNK